VTLPVGGATRVAGVIGDPVSHSRSPAIHNAGYAALGLDWVFVAFPVPAGQATTALDGVRALGVAGLSVTMPHKTDAAAACDELTPTASTLGVVNTVVNRDGRLLGDSTDGAGLLRALTHEGVDVRGTSLLVLGAGGAARAIVLALADAGADVVVAARRLDAARAAADLAADIGAIGFDDLDGAVRAASVVINATPLGMQDEPPPFDPASLDGRSFVVDTVYHPAETPLLRAAKERGVPCANGLGMLVHQAALAFELFTGCEGPLPAMWEAATRE
jgi:shikimate dehydrogenase